MGKIILYGIQMSAPVRTVLLTAKELDIDFEFREINVLKGENKDPIYLRKNPQQTIPTLEDDDKIIWDSHAIIAYLVGKYAKDDSLYPKELFHRAIVDQRLHFDSGVLFPATKGIFMNLLFNDDHKISEEENKQVDEAYGFLEKFLGTNEFLTGDHLTIADFSCVTTVSSLQCVVPVDADKYPNLMAWLDRMAELPYYEEINGAGLAELIAHIQSKINISTKI